MSTRNGSCSIAIRIVALRLVGLLLRSRSASSTRFFARRLSAARSGGSRTNGIEEGCLVLMLGQQDRRPFATTICAFSDSMYALEKEFMELKTTLVSINHLPLVPCFWKSGVCCKTCFRMGATGNRGLRSRSGSLRVVCQAMGHWNPVGGWEEVAEVAQSHGLDLDGILLYSLPVIIHAAFHPF